MTDFNRINVLKESSIPEVTSDSTETHRVVDILIGGGALSDPNLVGKRMVFAQSAAPLGWTKITTAAYNGAMMVGETGNVSVAGTQDFLSHTHTFPLHSHSWGSHSHTQQDVTGSDSGGFDGHQHNTIALLGNWGYIEWDNNWGGSITTNTRDYPVRLNTDENPISPTTQEISGSSGTDPTGTSSPTGGTSTGASGTSGGPVTAGGAASAGIAYRHVIVCTKDP